MNNDYGYDAFAMESARVAFISGTGKDMSVASRSLGLVFIARI